MELANAIAGEVYSVLSIKQTPVLTYVCVIPVPSVVLILCNCVCSVVKITTMAAVLVWFII